jgi:hypothetical protein
LKWKPDFEIFDQGLLMLKFHLACEG